MASASFNTQISFGSQVIASHGFQQPPCSLHAGKSGSSQSSLVTHWLSKRQKPLLSDAGLAPDTHSHVAESPCSDTTQKLFAAMSQPASKQGFSHAPVNSLQMGFSEL